MALADAGRVVSSAVEPEDSGVPSWPLSVPSASVAFPREGDSDVFTSTAGLARSSSELLSGANLAHALLLKVGHFEGLPRYVKGASRWFEVSLRPFKGGLVGPNRMYQLPNHRGLVAALRALRSEPARFWNAFNNGMPQGFPTSPFMSMLSLRSFLTQQTSISYADDPVFFGDTEFKIKACGPANQEINEEKSN